MNRILIADDENDIRNLLKISWREQGIPTHGAKRKEAWDLLTAQMSTWPFST
jgi:CheY-like chemotaxis protein